MLVKSEIWLRSVMKHSQMKIGEVTIMKGVRGEGNTASPGHARALREPQKMV